ncbi:MAG: chemotaxis protein CheD [Verrucomicrobiota bacterium JB022]|nr:chemotaxis protein CheD [Verrucomicrobiota bacterium JB022]
MSVSSVATPTNPANNGGAPSLGSLLSERIVVGVGDMAVSNRAYITISTYALGSCVGVIAYDPAVQTGGILHLMLPESKLSPERARQHPAVFADTGIPQFLKNLVSLGARPGRMVVFIGGGALTLNQDNDLFKIGERNVAATRQILAHEGIQPKYSSVGGNANRSVHLEIGTGKMTLRMPQGTKSVVLG